MSKNYWYQWSTEELNWLAIWAEEIPPDWRGQWVVLLARFKVTFPGYRGGAGPLTRAVKRLRSGSEVECADCGGMFHEDLGMVIKKQFHCNACANSDDPEAMAIQVEQVVYGLDKPTLPASIFPTWTHEERARIRNKELRALGTKIYGKHLRIMFGRANERIRREPPWPEWID